MQRCLHTLQCFEPGKVNQHLDTLIEIQDSLTKRDVIISDEMFINTITASIPDMFKPTINALIVVSSKTDNKLTPEELIATIRAEAMGHTRKKDGKKELANYAGNS